MASAAVKPALAAVFGCSGLHLSDAERSFFRDADPLGFILFRRNVDTPEQVAALVRDLRDAVGRPDAPVLVDQEGGRVVRLRPPHWRRAPAAGRIGALAEHGSAAASRAAWLNARLLADEVSALGISVDCLPVLDLAHPGAHDVIGDRAFGADPALVAALGRASCEGLLAGGVLPVIKHMPGHGRALADSHLELPRVTADLDTLEATDFAPFRALAEMPVGMTAHIVFTAIDDRNAATVSSAVIADVIRGWMGFDGLLLSDDLSMQALGGGIAERAAAALAAGCDVALHCNGDADEMNAVAGAVRPLDPAAERRLARALEMVHGPAPFDRGAALAELADLLGDTGPLA